MLLLIFSMIPPIKIKLLLVFFALVAFKVKSDIVVDGKLDETEWSNAIVLKDFVLTEPLTGELAPYKTQAYVFTNPEGIFIGIKNHQPESIKRVRTKFARDSWMAADRNIIIIDFDGTAKSAYEFTVSLSNTQQDGVITEETRFQYDWDGTWYSATSESGEYWYNEIRIPWGTVPMTEAEGERDIGVYVSQVIHNKKQRIASINAAWQRSTFVSDLQKIQVETYSTQTIDFFPYITLQQDQINHQFDNKVGADLFWKPRSNQQLSLAVNPDFGQVESDNLVVNFSSIESFFSEKRPFFTENQSLFTKQFSNGGHLIHTRRIGSASDDGEYATSDIDYALKFSHFGQSVDIGGFVAQEADHIGTQGRSYAVSRIEKKLEDLRLGHYATYVDRPDLDRESLVNAVDIQWQPDNDSRLNGMLSLTDITVNGKGVKGESVDFSYRTSINDIWSHDVNFIYLSDDYELNDMGFMWRNDLKRLAGQSKYIDREFSDESARRDQEYKLEYNYRTNAANDRLESNIEIGSNINFKDTSRVYFELKRIFNSVDDRTMQNGEIFKRDKRWGTFALYDGVETKDVRHRFRGWAYEQDLSGFAYHLSYEPTWNITDSFTVNGKAAYTTNNQWLIWREYVEADGGEVATFREKKIETTANINWLIDEKQELRVKFQWIGIQADFKQGYLPGLSGYLTQTNYQHESFEVSNTALQIRYRYELAPLSNIFLVWSRGGNYSEYDTSQGLDGLLSEGWSEKTDDQFLVKVRYRF